MFNHDLPWLPLYAPDIMNAYSKQLKNYTPNTFLDFYNVWNWSFE
ncbi:MAG: hypothetical protein Q4A55_03095 [Aerococcus sp.]|nr:hypothetical protein [Aerococcus sp.]